MSRLFRVLRLQENFDARQYDLNNDGHIGWSEFCLLWRQLGIAVQFSTAERMYITLEDPQASRLGRIASGLILATISVSAGAFVISTLPIMQEQPCPACAPVPRPLFVTIDTVCVIVFTIEYVLRLSCAIFTRSEVMN